MIFKFQCIKCNVNYETLSHGLHPTSRVWMYIGFPKIKANIRHTEDSKTNKLAPIHSFPVTVGFPHPSLSDSRLCLPFEDFLENVPLLRAGH